MASKAYSKEEIEEILACLGAGSTKDIVAIDCEKIAITNGPGRGRELLAQVSIVGFDGNVLYQSYVNPHTDPKNIDYRTKYSGITKETPLAAAPNYKDVRAQAIKLLKGKVVVGHALENEVKALDMSAEQASRSIWIDTYKMAEFQLEHPGGMQTHGPRLKVLALACLGKVIQRGVHDATEDAVAALEIVKRVCVEGKERTRENLLRITAEFNRALEGRNVPAAANYDKAKSARLATKRESITAHGDARKAKATYEDAVKASLVPEVVAAAKKAHEEANERATALEKSAQFLDKEQDRIKRIRDDRRREARNAIVLEGVDPNTVAPRTAAAAAAEGGGADAVAEGGGAAAAAAEGGGAAAAAAAAAAVAANKKPAMGGAGGGPPARKSRRRSTRPRNPTRRRT